MWVLPSAHMLLKTNCTYAILQVCSGHRWLYGQNIPELSFTLKFITWVPATVIFFPACSGYWHVVGGRQNLPNPCGCLGQIVIPSICFSPRKHNPALAKIKSLSCTRSLDKWHFARCAVMSSMQLFNLINSSSSRLGLQSSPAAAFSEHRFAIHAHQYVLILNKEINPILLYNTPPHLQYSTVN